MHPINAGVVCYVLVGYCTGLYSVLTLQYVGLGVPLLAHTMVFAAYLIHELMHNTLCPSAPKWVATLLGSVLLWICGSPYADYHELRHMHLLHHSSKADTTTFDYKVLLNRVRWLWYLVLALEYIYFPAVEWLAHINVVIRPLAKRQWAPTCRIVLLVILRAALFIRWAERPWPALAWYIVVYNLMVTILRLGDCFQHTYEVIVVGGAAPDISARTPAYEQLHTYSNVFTTWPILNFLLHLNFGYHNVHHHRPTLAWFDLPTAHADISASVYPHQTLSMGTVLWHFHTHRIRRILTTEIDVNIGFVGVSFLTDVK